MTKIYMSKKPKEKHSSYERIFDRNSLANMETKRFQRPREPQQPIREMAQLELATRQLLK